MAAGDVEVYISTLDNPVSAIPDALSSNGVVVADDITAVVNNGIIIFTVIKAA